MNFFLLITPIQFQEWREVRSGPIFHPIPLKMAAWPLFSLTSSFIPRVTICVIVSSFFWFSLKPAPHFVHVPVKLCLLCPQSILGFFVLNRIIMFMSLFALVFGESFELPGHFQNSSEQTHPCCFSQSTCGSTVHPLPIHKVLDVAPPLKTLQCHSNTMVGASVSVVNASVYSLMFFFKISCFIY